MTETLAEIPVLSLGHWHDASRRGGFVADLRDACHHVGFFHLVDHGVDHELFDDYFRAVAAFFALPAATKREIDKRRSPHFRGWEDVGAELTDNRVDHREQLDVSTENPPYPRDATPAYLRLDGPNQWPAEADAPGFRALVVAFHDRLRAVAYELMNAISLALGLDEEHLAGVFGERTHSLVKIIRYPPSPPGEAGVNAHHDAGFLTLLKQHEIGGLQVLVPTADGERWIDVAPHPTALVVNLGEMLQSMTGNYFVATTHRVIALGERFSSAYFHGPDLRTSLAPLPLAAHFHDAVAASARHAGAGFMARREELLAGHGGTRSAPATTYGEQLWNYYRRSYPENMRAHYPDERV